MRYFNVYLDEASRILGRVKTQGQGLVGESVTIGFLRVMRALRIVLYGINQDLSSLDPVCQKLAGCKIVFAIDNSEHRIVAESLGLRTPEEYETLRTLKPRCALVRMNSRSGLPLFEIEVPPFTLDKSATEEEIDEMFKDVKFDVNPLDEEFQRQVMALFYNCQVSGHRGQFFN